MSRPLHIVIDNTFPPLLVRELAVFWRSSYPNWTIRHQNDIDAASAPDKNWIARLSSLEKAGDWLILTADKGKNDRKQNDKLPVVCRSHGHSYLIISQSIAKFDQWKAAFSALWSSLPLVIQACQRTRSQTGHVTLAPFSLRRGEVAYRLQYRGKPIEELLASPMPAKTPHSASQTQSRVRDIPPDFDLEMEYE